MPVDWRLVDQTASKYGIPKALFRRLVRQESGGNPRAVSAAGAIGLTQLMPQTARGLGVDPYNPAQNLAGGARYLQQQYQRFGGDWRKALAAYNAGPGAVQKYGGVPPFGETQRYVQAILGGLQPGPMRTPVRAAATPQNGSQEPAGLSPALAAIFNQNNELLGVPGLPLDLTRRQRGAGQDDMSAPAPQNRRAPRLPRGGGLRFLTQLVEPHGLQITSTTRGKHVKNSWHYQGRAVDVVGSDAQIRALAAQVRRNPRRFKEFFYDPLGWYVKNGRIYKGSIGGHGDHAHVAA